MARLITGAGGSIGSQLARFLSRSGEKLILIDNSEFALFKIYEELSELRRNDVTPILSNLDDVDQLKDLFKDYSVKKVYNAAAYKHVNLVELNRRNALKNNLMVVLNLIDAINSSESVVEFIQISTDKAVNPINMMGFSKRVCELCIENLLENSSSSKTVRFGNVLDSNGSVVPIFREQIRKGGPVTLTSFNARRFFMTIPQACELVIAVDASIEIHGTYILDMGKDQSIFDLAQNLINEAGYEYSLSEEEGKIQIVEIGLRRGEKEIEQLTSGRLCITSVHGVYKVEEQYSEMDHEIVKILSETSFEETLNQLINLYDYTIS